MEIQHADFANDQLIELLEQHHQEMYATSPPESVHVLDVKQLQDNAITLWMAVEEEQIVGCIALKELNSNHGEIKSLRIQPGFQNRGYASKLLDFVILKSRERGYTDLSLETGIEDYFKPAVALYQKFGFSFCGPFDAYQPDENSYFMTLSLKK